MTTAIDSSVLLDLVIDSPRFADLSTAELRRARSDGRLIICSSVVAELRPALPSDSELIRFIDDLGIDYVPDSQESALLAGTFFALYLSRKDSPLRVLPDFLIGAHAKLHADRLLARDRGYFRDYFGDLEVIDPSDSTK